MHMLSKCLHYVAICAFVCSCISSDDVGDLLFEAKRFFLAASSPVLKIIHPTVSHEVILVLAVSCWAKNVRFTTIVSPSRRHLGSSPIQPFLVKKNLFRTDVFNLLKSRARCNSFSESANTDPLRSIQSFAYKAKFSEKLVPTGPKPRVGGIPESDYYSLARSFALHHKSTRRHET